MNDTRNINLNQPTFQINTESGTREHRLKLIEAIIIKTQGLGIQMPHIVMQSRSLLSGVVLIRDSIVLVFKIHLCT